MPRRGNSVRPRHTRITATALALALAGPAVQVPLGTGVPVAHAQVAPIPQVGLSHGAVRQTFGVNPDWEASVFFNGAMQVNTVAIDFVPQKTGQSSLERPKEAPKDDPVFNVIPETATYTVKHYKLVNRRAVEAGSYEVTGRRSQVPTPSGHWAIRIAYELPNVAVEPGDRLALYAPGMGTKYPKPLAGGDIRFTMPRVNSGFGGTIRVHNPDSEPVGQPKLLVQQGGTSTETPVNEDGTYDLTINGASGTYALKVVPPAGFATPETRMWDVSQDAPEPDFDVYPITVTGRVLDASGQPVAGARVSVGGRSALTDANGNFTVTKVPTGTHNLVVGATDRTQETTRSNFTVRDQRDNPIGSPIRVQDKQQYGSITGTVAGVPNGATVRVRAAGTGVSFTISVQNGTYALDNIETGNYTVEVVGDTLPAGYSVTGPRRVSVAPNATSHANFTITADKVDASVKVIDENNAPVSGAWVTVAGSRRETDTNGEVTFTGVTPGKHTAKVVESDTYSGNSQAFEVKPATGGATTVKVGSHNQVSGTVVDSLGDAVAEANVVVKQNGIEVKTFRTDADGKFDAGRLPGGTYTAQVQKTDRYGANSKSFTVTGTSGTPSVDLTVPLHRGAVEITTSGDADPESVVVVGGPNEVTEMLTKTNGKYILTGLYPGNYNVTAKAPRNHTVSSDRPVPLTVEPNQTATVAFTVTADDGSLTGVLVDEFNTRLPGASVTLTGPDGTSRTVQAGSDGSIEVDGLRPGKYTVLIEADGYEPVEQSVKIGPGESKHLNVPGLVAMPGSISGKVVDESGHAVSGATVTLTGPDGTPRTVQAGSDGSLNVDGLRPGEYTVRIEAPGYEPVEQTINIGPGESKHLNVPGLVAKPGSISGKVVDESGHAVSGATVTLTGPDGTPRTVQVGADGSLNVDGLRPGEYTVRIEAPGYEPVEQTINIGPGENKQLNVPGLVAKPGSISGDVIDDDGNPVAGATVTLTGPDGTPRTVQVGADGSLNVDGLRPGEYTVRIEAPGYEPVEQSVKVNPGESVSLGAIPLTKKPTPTPKPTTSKPTPTPTTTPTTTPTPATTSMLMPTTTTPKPSYRWEPVVVKQGEVGLTDPKQQGTNAKPPSTGFKTVGVTQVSKGGGKQESIPVEDWIQVEDDGTIVATPPAGATPGEYEVEIETPSGTREKVTVQVTPQPPMAQRYDVTGPTVAAPAGTVRTAPSLRAQVTEAGFVYDDRVLPPGTTFDVQHEWASVDANGRVTFSPPKNAKRGNYDVSLVINYPDGSTDTVTVTFVVGDPLYADLLDYGYEEGLQVLPGRTVTLLRTSEAALPEGTTFKIKGGADLSGWSANVDEVTGHVRVTAPESGGSEVTVPVVAYFPDGSSLERNAGARLATTTAHAATAAPEYTATVARPGETVLAEIKRDQPAGASFTVVDDGGLDVGVDKNSGALKITVPKDAQLDETYKVTVRAVYPDGSAGEVVAEVLTQSDAQRYELDFTGANVPVGGVATQQPSAKVPDGTRFSTDGFDEAGWKVTIDEVTGRLSVSSTSDVPVGAKANVPVKVTYPDGSTETVNVPVVAQAEAGGGSSIGGSSVSSSWIAVLLGVLALLAGAGYGAWLNQDKIMEALRG
ncbi:carboxypeptidase regulatory-like domain-containing protein [Corynebacterium lujinxingii]|uniref:Carboxypeptidase regulatory-like domain-containing protein n=1 Tax=Corynebacterium lujinxingii TaxID=2763010 RepID=A0A7H0K0K5_9CORY|nr:carboxypeptidase regulatory-like domain-containing protein [Corynebacterium lujinxingii]QNP90821.1 carboxypeptidase regulatory-like domain-containing protein [Corynebacterium lujinxingii]